MLLVFCELTVDYGVVVPVDEGVFGLLVAQDAEFGVHIVLHLVFVAIHVVGGNVHQHGYVYAEFVHVVELETAQFHYVVVLVAFGYLQCEALAYVAGETYVETCFAEDVIYERSGCGLAVAAGDTHHFGFGVAACKFYFGDYGYAAARCRAPSTHKMRVPAGLNSVLPSVWEE